MSLFYVGIVLDTKQELFKGRTDYEGLGKEDQSTLDIVSCQVDKNGAISILPINATDKEGKGEGYFFSKATLNQQKTAD